MTTIARLIDHAIKGAPATLLKAQGFTRAGHDFHRMRGDLIDVVNFLSSVAERRREGRLTINVGIYSQRTNEALLRKPQPRPHEYDCALRSRIGELLPSGIDKWWTVDPETDSAKLATELSIAVELAGLPWLEGIEDLPALSAQLAGTPSLEAAASALALGDRGEAERRLQTFGKRFPRARPMIEEWARQALA
ncbi:MAG: DUF4304 domain-containing protein [Xanthomonadaceae bacterium]|nr:DUF4304 domain-containing protein [Xanthomonadaceae bacterium]